MGDLWEIGFLFFGGGRGKPNVEQIVKKIGEKISKIGEIRKKNQKNLIFFFTKNGLKSIRNPTKHL